ncbi:MAG TPA: hypothetical protein VFA04_00935 [Bryobacteraceae bacterium]|nr:hypothetical protein [Bryobacteraceae bacterium]
MITTLTTGTLALVAGCAATARADVVAPGTEVAVRTDASIDVAHWDRGRIYPAHVARDWYR